MIMKNIFKVDLHLNEIIRQNASIHPTTTLFHMLGIIIYLPLKLRSVSIVEIIAKYYYKMYCKEKLLQCM